MSNILIVSGSYFPYASANAICMKEFERAMTARGDKVVYAIRKHDIDTPEITYSGDIKIYHVERTIDMFFFTAEKLKSLRLPLMIRALTGISLGVIKVCSHLYAKIRYGSLRKYAEELYLKQYAETIAHIIESENIDTVISVSMPFLSHKAVLRCKKRYPDIRIKWIAYMIDAYSQKFGNSDPNKIIEEKEVIESADRTIMLSVLRSSYDIDIFREQRTKISYLPLPLLNFNHYDGENRIKMEKKKIDFVFAGMLYDDDRKLDYFVKFVKAIDSPDYRFHFMGKYYSRNTQLLQQLKENVRSEITIYGVKPFDFAENSVAAADVVLNFGNLSVNQIPSKIYRSIVKRKPILTFYKIDEDPSLPMLKKYPLACNIKESESIKESDMERFRKFVRNLKQTDVTESQLRALYKDDISEVVCEQFLKYI